MCEWNIRVNSTALDTKKKSLGRIKESPQYISYVQLFPVPITHRYKKHIRKTIHYNIIKYGRQIPAQEEAAPYARRFRGRNARTADAADRDETLHRDSE